MIKVLCVPNYFCPECGDLFNFDNNIKDKYVLFEHYLYPGVVNTCSRIGDKFIKYYTELTIEI